MKLIIEYISPSFVNLVCMDCGYQYITELEEVMEKQDIMKKHDCKNYVVFEKVAPGILIDPNTEKSYWRDKVKNEKNP